MATLRARFIPRFPEKYTGDVNKIFVRSSWEAAVMKYFDSKPDILKWGSEEISIPYLSPKDGQVHQYFPDFIIEYVDKDGNVQKEMVEVKPLVQTTKKLAEKNVKENWHSAAAETNEAKWKAAHDFCAANGMKFRVLTEKSIFHQGVKASRKTKVNTNG